MHNFYGTNEFVCPQCRRAVADAAMEFGVWPGEFGYATGGLEQETAEKINDALKLNPKGGYVKGSAARRKLDQAVTSVPGASAANIRAQLQKPTDPIGKLFRRRLKPATQKVLLDILARKAAEFQRQEVERIRREEEIKKRQKEVKRQMAKALCDENERLRKESEEATDKALKAARDNDWKTTEENKYKMKRAERRFTDNLRRVQELGFWCPVQ